MRNAQIQVLSAASTASATGAALDTRQTVSASFQIVMGDVAGAGTVKIQCSNDNPASSGSGLGPSFVPTNWSDIPNAASTVVAGVAPAILIPNMAFAYVRVVFTRTAGTTTIIVNANVLSI